MNLRLRKITPLAEILALLFAAAMCLSPVALHAQTQQQQPGMQHAQQMPHSFTGTVVQLKNGHYALVMGKGPQGQPEGHFLQHAQKAKKFVGKQVKVNGKLNMSNNTVDVTSIQPR